MLTKHVQLKGGAFKDAAFRKIRYALQGQAKAGWYQGSLYFAVMGESSRFGTSEEISWDFKSVSVILIGTYFVFPAVFRSTPLEVVNSHISSSEKIPFLFNCHCTDGRFLRLVVGFINLRWATDGFKGDRIDMAILSLIATTYLGSAAWYVKTGDPATAVVLTPMGLLQIVGALKA
jgi:hypothetical protein